jgi:hypothetical protein
MSVGNLCKKNIFMTLQLEIQSENDLKLFLSLAQRLKIKTNTIDNTQSSNYDTLSWQQVSDRLMAAENQESISFSDFKTELESWK